MLPTTYLRACLKKGGWFYGLLYSSVSLSLLRVIMGYFRRNVILSCSKTIDDTFVASSSLLLPKCRQKKGNQ